jgi:uncharacterized protein YkwD
MENYNKNKYKLIIIIVVMVLVPVIIFNKAIFHFVSDLFYKGGEVLDLVINNKEDDPLKNKEKIIEIKPETPGALNLLDRFVKPSQETLDLNKVIYETNVARVKNKLTELKENKILNLSAEKKVKDILENQYFEHVSPDGVGIDKLSKEVGYEYILIGENLAMGGFKDEKALVDAWMGSFGHRKNVLKSNYTELGVAISKGIFKGEEVWVAVQHFGTPKSACPKVDENLYNVATYNEQQIKSLNDDLPRRLFEIKTNRGFNETEKKEQAKRIEEYNNLVLYNNRLVDQVKNDVTTYNNQVKSFNECVKKYEN